MVPDGSKPPLISVGLGSTPPSGVLNLKLEYSTNSPETFFSICPLSPADFCHLLDEGNNNKMLSYSCALSNSRL